MARAMSAPWIQQSIFECLDDSGDFMIAKTRVCQIVKTHEKLECITISDGINSIAVFMTRDCIQNHFKHAYSGLKNCFIQLEKFHFSLWIESAANRDVKNLMSRIPRPLVIQCSKLTVLGGFDSTIIGDPTDINKDSKIERILKSMQYNALSKRLMLKQFENVTSLPDASE